MEYYAAEKNNDFMKFAGKWMELENVILSEVPWLSNTVGCLPALEAYLHPCGEKLIYVYLGGKYSDASYTAVRNLVNCFSDGETIFGCKGFKEIQEINNRNPGAAEVTGEP
ncbi:hypothetical protein STEG23_013681 [Scotinomys teguina]